MLNMIITNDGKPMKTALVCLAVALTVVSSSAPAQNPETVPQFQVHAVSPKPFPNKWILGQVSGIATDRFDRVWVVHRPRSLTPRERAAEGPSPEGKCCVAAPPVLVFDGSGNFLFSWGGPGAGYEWPESEHGIFVDANDFVWLAGNGKADGQLLKFTMDGKFVLQIGKSGAGNDSNSTEPLGSPPHIAVDTVAQEALAAPCHANPQFGFSASPPAPRQPPCAAYGTRPSAVTPPR